MIVCQFKQLQLFTFRAERESKRAWDWKKTKNSSFLVRVSCVCCSCSALLFSRLSVNSFSCVVQASKTAFSISFGQSTHLILIFHLWQPRLPSLPLSPTQTPSLAHTSKNTLTRTPAHSIIHPFLYLHLRLLFSRLLNQQYAPRPPRLLNRTLHTLTLNKHKHKYLQRHLHPHPLTAAAKRMALHCRCPLRLRDPQPPQYQRALQISLLLLLPLLCEDNHDNNHSSRNQHCLTNSLTLTRNRNCTHGLLLLIRSLRCKAGRTHQYNQQQQQQQHDHHRVLVVSPYFLLFLAFLQLPHRFRARLLIDLRQLPLGNPKHTQTPRSTRTHKRTKTNKKMEAAERRAKPRAYLQWQSKLRPIGTSQMRVLRRP